MGGPWDAELIEFDELNEVHLARHGVTPAEVLHVFHSQPLWAANKKGMTANDLMIGRSEGGRPLVIATVYDHTRRVLRPITARTCTDAEIIKWQI